MNRAELPAALRDAISSDLKPVRPLSPVWRRALIVGAMAVVVMIVVVSTTQLRADLASLSILVGWGAAFLELFIGIVLIGLSLRESVPGLALSPGAIAAALGLGAAVNIIIVFATWAGSSAANAYTEPFMEGVVCSRAETLFGVPALIVTLILVARALPLRPHVVGLLAGCGAGMIGDGINHLLCPISTLRHVLVWHSGVIVLLALLGWGAGLGWEFYEARRA
ncbi:MAG: DUF1109 domain-containing protein [Acidobacteria bacterium]|jgi:hypothetical protein|nr:DUF1109 domain-containing protein [Acidobacteriota bacterium]